MMHLTAQSVFAINTCEAIFVAAEQSGKAPISFAEIIKFNLLSQNKTDQIRNHFDFFSIPDQEKAELFLLASLHQDRQFNSQKIDSIYQLMMRDWYVN